MPDDAAGIAVAPGNCGGAFANPELSCGGATGPGSVTCAICDMTILPLLSSNRASRLIRRCGPPALSQGSQKL